LPEVIVPKFLVIPFGPKSLKQGDPVATRQPVVKMTTVSGTVISSNIPTAVVETGRAVLLGDAPKFLDWEWPTTQDGSDRQVAVSQGLHAVEQALESFA
jgi:hypothetical protein